MTSLSLEVKFGLYWVIFVFEIPARFQVLEEIEWFGYCDLNVT